MKLRSSEADKPRAKYKSVYCIECSEMFADFGSMEKHRKHVHGKQNYECDTCSIDFRTKMMLTDHNNKYHSAQKNSKPDESCKKFNVKDKITPKKCKSLKNQLSKKLKIGIDQSASTKKIAVISSVQSVQQPQESQPQVSKPELVPAPQPESILEYQPEQILAFQPEPVPAPQPESILEYQPEQILAFQPEPVPAPQPESILEYQPEQILAFQPEPVPAPQPESILEYQPEQILAFQPEPVPAPQPESILEYQPEQILAFQPEPVPAPQPQSIPESQPEQIPAQPEPVPAPQLADPLDNHLSRDQMLPTNTTMSHPCTECNIAFPNDSTMTSHIIRVHGSKQFKCEDCFIGYGNATILKIHMVRCHPKPSIIKIEPAEETRETSLVHHTAAADFAQLAGQPNTTTTVPSGTPSATEQSDELIQPEILGFQNIDSESSSSQQQKSTNENVLNPRVSVSENIGVAAKVSQKRKFFKICVDCFKGFTAEEKLQTHICFPHREEEPADADANSKPSESIISKQTETNGELSGFVHQESISMEPTVSEPMESDQSTTLFVPSEPSAPGAAISTIPIAIASTSREFCQAADESSIPTTLIELSTEKDVAVIDINSSNDDADHDGRPDIEIVYEKIIDKLPVKSKKSVWVMCNWCTGGASDKDLLDAHIREKHSEIISQTDPPTNSDEHIYKVPLVPKKQKQSRQQVQAEPLSSTANESLHRQQSQPGNTTSNSYQTHAREEILIGPFSEPKYCSICSEFIGSSQFEAHRAEHCRMAARGQQQLPWSSPATYSRNSYL